MNFFWVYTLPNWLFAALLIVVCVGVSIGGLILTRPLARRLFGEHPACNDEVGDVLQAASAFYGITLGLIAIGAWSGYTDVQEKVSHEASALAALYRDATMMPQPHGAALQKTLEQYTNYTIHEAWDAQRHGEVPTGGSRYINQFQAQLAAFNPKDAREQVLLDEIFRQYNVMLDLRRLRLDSVKTGMLPVLWVVVFAGAFVNMAIAWCMVLKNSWAHSVLVGLIAMLIALLLFLTAVMDNPFRGQISVGPDSFELIYDQVMHGGRVKP